MTEATASNAATMMTVVPWVWTKLGRYPGWVRHGSGKTETVQFIEGGMRFSAPMEWVEVEPPAADWMEMARSDVVEWRSDGHMYINGVDKGAHDVP